MASFSTSTVDDAIKEYLIFRGFTTTLKSLEAELRTDKDKGLAVENLIQQIFSFIAAFDLEGLTSFWDQLNRRFFAKLGPEYLVNARRLDISLKRHYLVHCVENMRQEKVFQFFDLLANDAHAVEWRDWWILPFTKNPEIHPVFESFFSKSWFEALQMSLFNFLSSVLHNVQLPFLLQIQKRKTIVVPEVNEMTFSSPSGVSGTPSAVIASTTLANGGMGGIAAAMVTSSFPASFVSSATPVTSSAAGLFSEDQTYPPPPHHTMAKSISTSFLENQEPPSTPNSAIAASTVVASLPSTSSSLTTSTAPGNTPNTNASDMLSPLVDRPRTLTASALAMASATAAAIANAPPVVGSHAPPFSPSNLVPAATTSSSSTSSLMVSNSTIAQSPLPLTASLGSASGRGRMLELGEDVAIYREHRAAVHLCLISPRLLAASLDANNTLEVWSCNPGRVVRKMSLKLTPDDCVTCMTWIHPTERSLALGHTSGRVLIITDVHGLVQHQSAIPLDDARGIMAIACDSNGKLLACAATEQNTDYARGIVVFLDPTTLTKVASAAVCGEGVGLQAVSFNRAGTLVVAGDSEGRVLIIDVGQCRVLSAWTTHHGTVYDVRFTSDETSVLSYGYDGLLLRTSLDKRDQPITQIDSHIIIPGSAAQWPGLRRLCVDDSDSIALMVQHKSDGQSGSQACFFYLNSIGMGGISGSSNAGTGDGQGRESQPPLVVFSTNNSTITCVDWCSSANVCICASSDGLVQIFPVIS